MADLKIFTNNIEPEAVAPFKNVIWVKEGGRRLKVGGKK